MNSLWGEGARWEEAGRRAPHAGRAVMAHSSPEPAAACSEERVGKEAGRRAPHAERAVMAHSSPEPAAAGSEERVGRRLAGVLRTQREL